MVLHFSKVEKKDEVEVEKEDGGEERASMKGGKREGRRKQKSKCKRQNDGHMVQCPPPSWSSIITLA